jgi:hypothetical protein
VSFKVIIMTESDAPLAVWIFYKNWRGQNAWRYVRPARIWFGRTQHHPEDQWFMDATDLKKNTPRSFALKDIGRWQREAPAGETP